jgi:hypothetical protein
MTRTAVLVLFAVSLLTACGDDGGAPSARTSPPPTRSAPAAPPASPSPASASPSTAQPPTPDNAADGRNLRACRDGACEVVVKAGDVLRFDRKVDTEPLDVISAGDRFTVGDGTGFAASTGGSGTIGTGSIQIQVGESEGDRTAIRISPRP